MVADDAGCLVLGCCLRSVVLDGCSVAATVVWYLVMSIDAALCCDVCWLLLIWLDWLICFV